MSIESQIGRWKVERERGIKIVKLIFERYGCPGNFDPTQVVIYFSGTPEYFTYLSEGVTIRYLGGLGEDGARSEEFVRYRDKILLPDGRN